MSAILKKISINRILSKIKRDYALDDLNETDLIEWAGEALEFISSFTTYNETVGFLTVKNHQIELPKYLHSIIQVAKNNCYSCLSENDNNSINLCPSTVIEAMEKECPSVNSEPYKPVCLDCEGKPLSGVEVAYYRPYFDLVYEYEGWNNSKLHKSCFSPIKLATNNLFNNLVCEEANKSIYLNCKDEYSIVSNNTIRFSFAEGQVAISYLKQELDSEGYPMIPDNVESIVAITKYIILKVSERNFYSNREGSESRLQYADKDWQWYCRQAKNKNTEFTIDDYENLLQQRSYLIPNNKHYDNFFGNLSTKENRSFNDPNHRDRVNSNYRRYGK